MSQSEKKPFTPWQMGLFIAAILFGYAIIRTIVSPPPYVSPEQRTEREVRERAEQISREDAEALRQIAIEARAREMVREQER